MLSRNTSAGVVAWVTLVVALATGATLSRLSTQLALEPADWLAFAGLAACASIAHRFPIRFTFDGASFRLTHVFVVAGAIVLPPALITPLALVAISPDLWFGRHRPRVVLGWLFNVAQTAISAHAAASLIRVVGGPQLVGPVDLLVLLVGAALFTAVQEVLVAVIVALDSRTPISRTGLFNQPALVSNGLTSVLGVAVAGLWLSRPVLLMLVLPILIMAHRLSRSAHLARLGQIDAKTGLHNSLHFERALAEELAHSGRLGKPAAVLFCDLDHFKRINDTYGHAAGDRVLHEVAERLKSVARRGDVLARFGGEEFVALLPGADADEAVYVAEATRAAISATPFLLEDGTAVRCTISIGAAAYPVHGLDASTLVGAADAAMYRAKQTRDAVALAETSTAGAETDRSADRRVAQSDRRGPAPLPTAEAVRVEAAPGPDWRAAVALWGTVTAGLIAAAYSTHAVQTAIGWPAVLPFLAFAVAGELLAVRVHDTDGHQISFSFGVVVTMAAVVALPESAPLVNLTAGLVHIAIARPRSLSKAFFNLANLPLSAAAAVAAYSVAASIDLGFSDPTLIAGAAAALAYYAVNMGTIAAMVSLHSRRRLVAVLTDSAWFTPTKVFFGLTGAFVGGAHLRLGPVGTAMFVAPLLILRFTLSFYAGRSQRAIGKLRALNARLASEVARRQRSEAELEHQALYDSLTGLPNRALLREKLEEAISSGPVALLLLDVDRFQEMNDTFGHARGDLLLEQIGERLGSAAGSDALVARLGGDEFAALLPAATREAAVAGAGRLRDTLRHPFSLEDNLLDLTASIGVALSPEHGTDPDTLLRRADVAMYAAKRAGSGWAVYTPEHDHYSPERLRLISQLREAIETGALELHYQPKIQRRTSRLDSVEALLRWPHPERGCIPPDEFIPLAEHTGLIKPLTRWVLDAALLECRVWHDRGQHVPVAVNVSTHDLQDASLPDLVSALLAKHGLVPELLRLEITEGAIMADPERALDVLTRVRHLGVGVSVDDFGTGYASLAYLTRLPVDELKIDRSFVQRMSTDEKQRAVVRSTIGLGHELGLVVVAEGVEDERAWDALGKYGCDVVQGYLVSRPMRGDAFARWLAESGWTVPGPLARAA